MTITRSLQIAFATVVVLGATLLGYSQERMWLPLAALLGAIASVTLTDITGRFRLAGFSANLAALTAVAFALLELTGITNGSSASFSEVAVQRLSSIANLLLYMQLVVMFQVKTVRVYWQLMTLSFLQVIVASALNSNLFFGVLLFGFLMVALLAMVLLQIYGDASSMARDATFEMLGHFDRDVDRDVGNGARFNPDEIAGKGTARNASSDEDRNMFPMPTMPPTMPPTMHRAVARYVVAITFGSMLFAGMLFLLTPRHGQPSSNWFSARRAIRNQTGYSNHVTFESTPAPIRQNDEIVMRVKILDHATGSPYAVGGAIALRGGVSENYQNREWNLKPIDAGPSPPMARPDQKVYEQIMVMEAQEQDALFSVYPVVKIVEDNPDWLLARQSLGPPATAHGSLSSWHDRISCRSPASACSLFLQAERQRAL